MIRATAGRGLVPLLLVGTLLSCATAVGCKSDADAQPAADKASAAPHSANATRVEVATMEPSGTKLDVELPGEVEADRDARLGSALGGYVESITVNSGDRVNKGKVLAMIDSAGHGARRHQAKVEYDTAKRELTRAKALADVLPRAQLDAAQARFNAARAALETANVAAARAVITAPFSGVIASVDIEVGEVAPPGAPVIRLIKTDPAKVTVSLSDRDVLAVRQGMSASVRTDARVSIVTGTVVHIHPAADTQSRSFIADIEVPNPDGRLLPGMIASVHLDATVADDRMVIAQDWLVTRPNELGVFINQNGIARWRKVTVGAIVRDRVVVESGIARGDNLVITGHRELQDGDPLLVARQGVCCTKGRVVFRPIDAP